MAILITGGTGFIGSYLAKSLALKHEKIVLFDISPRDFLIREIKDKVHIVKGDLSSLAQVTEVVKKHRIKGIYHTGALLSVSVEANHVAGYHANVEGTFNVYEAARILELERVVFLSSLASYGAGVPGVVDDFAVQRPTSMYGVSKVFGERLGEYYNFKFGLDVRGVRLPVVIGPGRGVGGAGAYLSLAVQEAALGRPYTIYVGEETVRPMIYVKDAVNCLISLYETDERKIKQRFYNIAGFHPTAREMVAAIRRYLPDAKLFFQPDQPITALAKSWPVKINDTRAREDWCWKPNYSLDETIQDFIAEIKRKPEMFAVK